MKKLKGALIGCGFFAENHILAWKELRNIEIICVCDLDIKKAKEYLLKHGSVRLAVKAFKDGNQTIMNSNCEYFKNKRG